MSNVEMWESKLRVIAKKEIAERKAFEKNARGGSK